MRYVFSLFLCASLVLLGDVWVQTDWEDGAGQTVYSDTTMFQAGNLEYLFHPGQLWLHSPNDSIWMKPIKRFEPGSNLATDIILANDTIFAATAFNGYVHYSSNCVAWNSMDTLPTAYSYGNLITAITYGKDSSIYIGGIEDFSSSSIKMFIWRSNDHKTWVSPDSLDTTHTLPAININNVHSIYSLISADDSTLLAGTDNISGYYGFVFRSFNRGVTWDTLGVYGIYITKFIQGTGDTIWMLTGDAGVVNPSGSIWYTTDKGTNWTTQGSVSDTLFFSAAKKDTMWIGGTGMNGGIYLSYDNGVTWAESPGDSVIPDTAIVIDISVARDGSIYASTYNDGKIYKSTDDGLSWTPIYDITVESSNSSITRIIQTKEGHLLASFGSNLGSGSDSAGVLLSSYASDGDIISSVFHSPFDTTSYGVLHYKKGGPGFVQVKIRTGSDSLMTDATDWDSCDIAQDGDSLLSLNSVSKQNYIQYRVSLHSSSSMLSPYFDSIAIEYNNDAGMRETIKQIKILPLFNIINNPVRNRINLLFSITKDRDVEISIYNIAGERIGTLLKTHLDKGVYHKTYSLKGFSSGIYFVSFKTGENVENKKIVVIK